MPIRKQILIAAGLCALLAAGWLTRRNAPEEPVSSYFGLGWAWHSTGVLSYPGSPGVPTAYRAPLYPAYLSVFAGSGDPRAARAAAGVLYFAGGALVYAVAAACASPWAGLAGAAIYALHPDVSVYASSLGIEFFYSLLLVVLAALLAVPYRQAGASRVFAACLLTGITLSARSVLVAFPPLLGALFSRGSPRRAALLALLCYLPLAPWTLRNLAHFRAFVPLERGAMVCNIYSASEGELGGMLPEEAWRRVSGAGYAAMTPEENDAALLRASARNVVERPRRLMAGVWKRLAAAAGFHPWLAAFAALNLLARAPAFNVLAGPVLLCLYYFLINAVFSVEPRYFMPLVPLLAALAGCGLWHCAVRFTRLESAGSPGVWAREITAAAAVAVFLVYGFSCLLLAREIHVTGTARTGLRADLRETVLPSGTGPKSLNDRGVLAMASGDLRGAEGFFRLALAEDPAQPEAALSLASLLLRTGRAGEARELCRKLASGLKAGLAGSAGKASGLQSDALFLTAAEDCASAKEIASQPEKKQGTHFTN